MKSSERRIINALFAYPEPQTRSCAWIMTTLHRQLEEFSVDTAIGISSDVIEMLIRYRELLTTLKERGLDFMLQRAKEHEKEKYGVDTIWPRI